MRVAHSPVHLSTSHRLAQSQPPQPPEEDCGCDDGWDVGFQSFDAKAALVGGGLSLVTSGAGAMFGKWGIIGSTLGGAALGAWAGYDAENKTIDMGITGKMALGGFANSAAGAAWSAMGHGPAAVAGLTTLSALTSGFLRNS